MRSYVTTPIYYASGSPHIGHVYSTIIADTIKRFEKMSNSHSFLITGTDEHGQKIEKMAAKHGVDIADFVDSRSNEFKKAWADLGLEIDAFIRTTEQDHKQFIQTIWKKLKNNGDIYLGAYSGKYCVECEQYYGETELVDGKLCPVHKKEIEERSEETYLFDLQKYIPKLKEIYKTKPGILEPSFYANEVLEMLNSEFENLSISRKGLNWGITVPNDSDHKVYVWIDALFSYISGINKVNVQPIFDLSNTTHVIGKDILKFHTIFWPAFLMALEWPLPKKIVVHGWWTVSGQKISKSAPETIIDPVSLAEELGIDSVRYGLLAQKPLYRDGDINTADIKALVNADLSNSLGNLCKRSATLALKLFDGKISGKDTKLEAESQTLIHSTQELAALVKDDFACNNFYDGIKKLKQISDDANAYFHKRHPWKAGTLVSLEHASETIVIVFTVLEAIAMMYLPIIPNTAEKIIFWLNKTSKEHVWLKTISPVNIDIETSPTIFERLK